MHKLKNLLMEKLDIMADKYRGKSPEEIPASVLESWCKTTEILENIATIEGMETYLDDMEMSGARGRDTRTGRFVSRDTMRSDMISGRAPRRMYYGESYDDGDLEEQLEDMINDRTLPNSKRDAARKMLAEIRKGNM